MKFILFPFKLVSVIAFIALLLTYASPFLHPETAPLLPFIGLTYPIILIGNLLVLLFWAVLRSRWAIYSLLVILLGGKLHFRVFAINLWEDKPKQNELKIMSYNVRLFDVYNPKFDAGRDTREQQFAFLRRMSPDVLCIQEYYKQDAPSRFVTVDSIFSIMGNRDYHERSAHSRPKRQNFGVAIFSKYPFIAKGDVMFDAQSRDDYNYCIYGDVVKDNDTFRIYNVHLQSIRLQQDYYTDNPSDPVLNFTEERGIRYIYSKLREAYFKRADQARRVANHINTSPYPVVVCGDFNDTPLSYTYNQFNRHLKDAFRNTSRGLGTTYIGKLPAGRIDYIFHSKELNSYQFHIQKEELSDHRAISCIVSK